MKTDLDRNIVTIRYNILNLPDTIQFKNGNQIFNRYAADGRKLSTDYLTRKLVLATPIDTAAVYKWVYDRNQMSVTGTAYIGNVEYLTQQTSATTKSYNLQRVHNAEGYADNINSSYVSTNYYYLRRDHLSNTREVWRAPFTVFVNNNSLNPATVVQRTQYYPSGLPWAEGTGANVQPYKYNGKEFVEMHGYDTYDYGARGYYAAIGRFSTMDPMAEKYYAVSPYAYCANNPIRYIDPTGMEFTEGAWKWVNKLVADVNHRQAEISKTIAEKKAQLGVGGLSTRQEKTLNRQIGRLEGQNTQFENVRSEVATLAASDQMYDVKTDNSLSISGSTPGMREDRAGAVFNFSNGNFDLLLPSSAGLDLFSHELKHAYQFETGAFSSGPRGIPFYDQSDEKEAYARGVLFGGSQDNTLPSIYDNLPKGPIDATNHQNIMHLLNNPSILQNISTQTRSAFRINGNTYKP